MKPHKNDANFPQKPPNDARGGVASPSISLATIIVAVICGAVAGWAVGLLGWPVLFISAGYGVLCGEMILRASDRRCSIGCNISVVIAMLVGAIGGRLVVAALVMRSLGVKPPLGALDVIADLVSPSPIPLTALLLTFAFSAAWIRYSTRRTH